jgi:hypothetical protein
MRDYPGKKLKENNSTVRGATQYSIREMLYFDTFVEKMMRIWSAP